MDQARTVNAAFALQTFQLTVDKMGSGTGVVASEPSGVNCGDDCDQTYTAGTEVTLRATPDPDSLFSGWNGGGCSGAGLCTVIMNADLLVTAIFDNPPPTANAGPDQTVEEGVLVTLDGSASTDLNDTLSYSWAQHSGPTVTLSDPAAALHAL